VVDRKSLSDPKMPANQPHAWRSGGLLRWRAWQPPVGIRTSLGNRPSGALTRPPTGREAVSKPAQKSEGFASGLAPRFARGSAPRVGWASPVPRSVASAFRRTAGFVLVAALVTSFAALTSHTSLHGQTTIRGTVTDARTGGPISTVDLRLLDETGGSVAAAVSGRQGEFLFQLQETGSFVLAISHVAYVPIVSQALAIESGDHLELEIRMDAGVLLLDPVTVVVTQRVEPFYIRDFRERAALSRRLGRGRIYTREDLDRLQPFSAQELLDTVLWTNRCRPTILLDGIAAGGRLNWLSGEDVEGVEIYRGVNQIPAQYYRSGMCGLVLVWQRTDQPMRPWSWTRVAVAGVLLALFGVLMTR